MKLAFCELSPTRLETVFQREYWQFLGDFSLEGAGNQQ